MEIIKLSSIDKHIWDQRGLQAEGANIFQLSSFLDRPLITLDAFNPIFLIVKDREKILAQLLLTEGSEITRLFADYRGFTIIRPLLNRFYKSYRFAYGPLIFDRPRYYEILEIFVKYLDENIFSKGIHVRNIIPPIHERNIDHEVFSQKVCFSFFITNLVIANICLCLIKSYIFLIICIFSLRLFFKLVCFAFSDDFCVFVYALGC